MFVYSKKLQYPVKIDKPNPRLAAIIISQYGGPDGELGASLRYLSQRYSMPFDEQKGLLTDIGVEELGHLEMIGAIIHQLTRKLTDKQIQDSAFAPYFVDHTAGVYPTAASGFPWNAASIAVKGDPIADLTEDLAAEGTMVKEQPMFQTPEKALFYAGFRTFAPRTQNCRLRPHKNNNSQKYGRTSCFQGKNHKTLTGILAHKSLPVFFNSYAFNVHFCSFKVWFSHLNVYFW